MGIKRKKYDHTLRREAIRLAATDGVTNQEIEENLGLYQGAIGRWKKELRSDSDNAYPGNGKTKPIEDENRQLRRELTRVKRERDILKKAAAYFSMDSIKNSIS